MLSPKLQSYLDAYHSERQNDCTTAASTVSEAVRDMEECETTSDKAFLDLLEAELLEIILEAKYALECAHRSWR